MGTSHGGGTVAAALRVQVMMAGRSFRMLHAGSESLFHPRDHQYKGVSLLATIISNVPCHRVCLQIPVSRGSMRKKRSFPARR